MTNVNIFNEVTPQSGEFFKFKNIGDGIQGTYIDKQEGIDSFSNEQIIYLIKDKNKKIWNVAFRKTSYFVVERMASVKFGQIVGFKFDEERDSKKMPGKKAKIIRIYADSRFIDEEWLAEQKKLETRKQFDSTEKAPSESEENEPVIIQNYDEPQENKDSKEINNALDDAFAPSTKDNDEERGEVAPETTEDKRTDLETKTLDTILELAITKKLTSEGTSEERQMSVIEKYTKLPMINKNVAKIILKLTEYKK